MAERLHAPLTPARATAVPISGITEKDFRKVFRDVGTHISVGLKLYGSRRKDTDARFHDLFVSLDSLLRAVSEHQKTLSEGSPSFDFVHTSGERVEANGYRSLLYVLKCCLLELHKFLVKCAKDRSGVFFIPGDSLSNITAYTRALEGIELMLKHAVMLMEAGLSSQELFNNGEVSVTLKHFISSEYINRDVYYGRCLGFQYPVTLRRVLKPIAIGMASYEKWYRGSDRDPVRKLLQSLWKGSMYLQAPGQLGIKMDDLTQDCSVFYVKAFWSLLEQDTVKAAVNIISQYVDVSSRLEVPAKNITIEGSKGIVELTPPYSGVGFKPIPVLLISHRRRVGQSPPSQNKRPEHGLSPGLVVHIHGGGFVAQSSKSHEMYLRSWARELDTPIISIDYTLAPEAAFPRAVEEIVFAYAWILQNSERLGSTAERVVFVGDSAGGNFIISAAIKLARLGLRLPDTIVSCYPPTILTSAVSPSRFLSLMDILLPIGVLISCQQAYCGCVPEDRELRERKDARKRLWRAQGVIIPEPGSKSPVVMSPKRESQHAAKKETTKKRWSFRSRSKSTPPPRPSPPSFSYSSSTASVALTHQQSATEVGADVSLEMAAALVEVDLDEPRNGVFEEEEDPPASLLLREGEGAEEGEGVNGSVEMEQEGGVRYKPPTLQQHPLTSFCFHRHEPVQADELSPAERERLISEVVKSYESPDISSDPLMSVALAPLDMFKGLPPIHIIGAMLDPLVDDTVVLAKRLQAAGQPVTLNIFPDLPHGFLSLVSAGNEPQLTAAQNMCIVYIKRGLGLE